MITLGDQLDVIWEVTLLQVWAYSRDYNLLHKWLIGDNINLRGDQYREISEGKLTAMERHINKHDQPNKRGVAEIGWGVNKAQIPKSILQSEVYSLDVSPRYSDGVKVWVYVFMDEMEAQALIAELDQDDGVIRPNPEE